MFAIPLFLRRTAIVAPSSGILTLDRFVFAPGGSLRIAATSPANTTLFVGIYTSETISDLSAAEGESRALCATENSTGPASAVVPVADGAGFWEFPFSERTIVTVALCPCGSHAVSATALFRNGDSCLSADYIPSIGLKPAVGACYAALAAVWALATVRNRRPINCVWGLITASLALFVLDNFSELIVLLHDSKSDDQTSFRFFRNACRVASPALFVSTMVMAAWDVVRGPDERLQWKEFFALFAVGLFLGVPLMLIETYNAPLTESWKKLLEAGWLFLCWQLLFAIVFKRMKVVIENVDKARKQGDHKSTSVWQQYMVACYHVNLYAAFLWTSFMWVLIPFPEVHHFWSSQITLDVCFFVEFAFCVGLCATQRQAFEPKPPMAPSEEMQLHLIRAELEAIE
jgi:hypothetical protein